MSIVAIGIHSTVDFNPQIAANALIFVVLLALGWVSLYSAAPRAMRPRASAAPTMGAP